MSDTKTKNEKKDGSTHYTVKDAFKIADDVLKLSKDKEYHLGAFVHGLIFTLEYIQQSYNIPQQQLAIIKRDCRQYIKEIDTNVKHTHK